MTSSLVSMALLFALGAVGLSMLLCGGRLLFGPTAPDRVLALDTLYVNAVAFIVMLGVREGTDLYIEAALLIALLGFVSTVALARYLHRGDVID